jgi:hypothetical protein
MDCNNGDPIDVRQRRFHSLGNSTDYDDGGEHPSTAAT